MSLSFLWGKWTGHDGSVVMQIFTHGVQCWFLSPFSVSLFQQKVRHLQVHPVPKITLPVNILTELVICTLHSTLAMIMDRIRP